MSLFLYPKAKHVRTQKPRVFVSYKSYKRYLQAEFIRLCVYCRQPDSSAPNLNFGADHYRPKSIPRFASLIAEYTNLYYCCGSCNSRKTDYWPFDEKSGPYVVNPCDYEMAAHLRFDAATGRVESKTVHGKHTEELLQLNEPATVQYRLGAIRTVRSLRNEIEAQKSEKTAVEKWYKNGKITEVQRDAEIALIEAEISILTRTMQSHSGELPLRPIRSRRLGVNLTTS